MDTTVNSSEILPTNGNQGKLVGRVWSNKDSGPCLILVQGNNLHDISELAPTFSDLMEIPNLNEAVANVSKFPVIGIVDDFLASPGNPKDAGHLLAPCDLQSIKAAGVTFADSMLERVIEEQAKGDPLRANEIRNQLKSIVGEKLVGVEPGSAKSEEVKQLLQELDIWSQYLEVAIGPDAEIFTKVPPMSAVGVGAEIGIHPKSEWSNPEPEVVLVVTSRGEIVGVTLGNDVNLRDFEGRSALLLSKAKDNNASCAIGPFVRLLDDKFTLSDVEKLELSLKVTGKDGFILEGVSPMSSISRTPSDLVHQTINDNHQYPDGLMLFLGTMFAPTKDRFGEGLGFTHEIGDRVEITTPELGNLINWVNHSDKITPWTFGVRALMHNLQKRKLM